MGPAHRLVKIGLCGFTIAAREYVETFPLVEIQHTFYDPPDNKTLLRWREQAPPEFEFTLKAWQVITHAATSSTYRKMRTSLTVPQRAEVGAFRTNETTLGGWQRTLACARILRATAILFQCPASFRPTDENVENLRRFVGSIVRPQAVRLLWEPRAPAWSDALISTLCAELGLTHVVDPFVRPSVTTGYTYWRLHGIGSAYAAYTDEQLRTLAAQVPPTGETCVMFNNIPRPRDARRFEALVAP